MKLTTAIATTIALCASTVQSQQYSLFHVKSGTKCSKPAGAGGEFFNKPADQWGGLVGGSERDCNFVYFTANTLSGKIGVVPQVGEEFKMMYMALPFDNPNAAILTHQNYLCGHKMTSETFKIVRLGQNKVSGIDCSPLTFMRGKDDLIMVKRSDPLTGRGASTYKTSGGDPQVDDIGIDTWLCLFMPGVVNGLNANIEASFCYGPKGIAPMRMSDPAKTLTFAGNLGKNYDRFASTEYVLYDMIDKKFVSVARDSPLQMTTDAKAAAIFTTVTRDVERANEGFVAICSADNQCIRQANYGLFMSPLNSGNRQEFSWKINDDFASINIWTPGVPTGLKKFTSAMSDAWSISSQGDVRGGATNFVMVPKGLLGENGYMQIAAAGFAEKNSDGYNSYNFCIDVLGHETGNGKPVVLWECQGPLAQWGNQHFKYDEKQRLVSRHSGKCLDVVGWGTADGTPIGLWDCHDGDNQKWTYDDQGRIQGKHSGKCLSVAKRTNRSPLQISSCSDSLEQKFAMPSPLNQFLLAIGPLFFKSSLNGQVVETFNSGARDLQIGNHLELARHRFAMDHEQRLMNFQTKKCLTTNGNVLEQIFCDESFPGRRFNAILQKWVFGKKGTGKWFYDDKGRLRSFDLPDRCLDASTGQLQAFYFPGNPAGEPLQMKKCTDELKFKFTRY